MAGRGAARLQQTSGSHYTVKMIKRVLFFPRPPVHGDLKFFYPCLTFLSVALQCCNAFCNPAMAPKHWKMKRIILGQYCGKGRGFGNIQRSHLSSYRDFVIFFILLRPNCHLKKICFGKSFQLGTSSMTCKVTGEGDETDEVPKKSIAIFGYKQRIWSLDMKTKLVQQV